MKNFLLQETVHGKSRWLLLRLRIEEGDNAEYQPFSDFVFWMEKQKGYSPNTIDQYAGHIARFLDFIYEASEIASDPEMSYLIYIYEDYLAFGSNSDIQEVVELAERLNKSRNTSYGSISQGIEASIKLYLEYQILKSESADACDIFKKYYVDTSVRTEHENRAIKDNSWLAGTIKDSLKRSLPKNNTKLFSASKTRMRRTASGKSLSLNKTKAFPLDKAVDFLTQHVKGNRAVFVRNMCFFSLLAASGARSSEILQLRAKDIDATNRLIYLRSPFDRNFNGLTPGEVRALSWKGRTSEETFLIEPFASIFWSYFSEYITDIFRSNVNHDFVFQKGNGRPLFTWDISNRNKVMRKYMCSIGLDINSSFSPHSFRHMYGFYTLNYLPLNNGESLGLPMAYVKILMGHQSIKSTERYALQDIDMVAMYIEFANNFTKNTGLNIGELKRRFIDKQIARLESLKESKNV